MTYYFLGEKNRTLGGPGRDRTVLRRAWYFCQNHFYSSL